MSINQPPKTAKTVSHSPRESKASAETSGQPQLVFVELSHDEMSARVTILPPDNQNEKFTTIDDVRVALAQHHVVYGIKTSVLADISEKLARHAATKDFTEMTEAEIAVGHPVVHGQDAQLEYLYKTETEDQPESNAPPEDEEGQLDYRAGHSIENVLKGTLLVRRTPFTRGTPGKTVTGNIIPPKEGKDLFLGVGRGIVIYPEKPNEYYADIDGQILIKDRKISVQSIYEVRGDVDLSVGNIDFFGTVIVRGDVKDGFKIRAGEDLVIRGVVEGAELKVGGHLTISGGLSGNDKANIVCGGDALIKYIQNSTVKVDGDLTVKQSILHSKVVCDKTITVAGQKGMIAGSQVIAHREISASYIGSGLGTSTELVVGSQVDLRENLLTVEARLKDILLNLGKAKKELMFLKDLNTKMGGNLPQDKKEIYTKFSRFQLRLTAESKVLLEKKRDIEMQQKELQDEKLIPKISCYGVIYPGVKVTIKKAFRQFVDEQKRCLLTESEGEVKVSNLNQVKPKSNSPSEADQTSC